MESQSANRSTGCPHPLPSNVETAAEALLLMGCEVAVMSLVGWINDSHRPPESRDRWQSLGVGFGPDSLFVKEATPRWW